MTDRLGIAVDSGTVRAVLVRGGAVATIREVTRVAGEPAGTAVMALLKGLGLPRFRQPRMVIALGPALSQTRRLAGLPPLSQPHLLRGLVREGAERFFLRNGHPLVTSGVRLEEPGIGWCSAFNSALVAELVTHLHAQGRRVDGIVASAAAVAHVAEQGEFLLVDGSSAILVETHAGQLSRIQRTSVPGPEDTIASPIPVALESLGPQAPRFCAALGAALLPLTEPLLHAPKGPRSEPSSLRLAIAAAAAVVALSALLLLPGLKAQRVAAQSELRLERMAQRAEIAAEAHDELIRAGNSLSQVADLAATRWSPTERLAELSNCLPPGSALLSMRFDSTGGSLEVITPRTALLVAAISRIKGVAGVEINGPVRREQLNGIVLERVNVHFRRRSVDELGGDDSAAGAAR